MVLIEYSACYIEQNHDDNGIIWDNTLAPFQIHLMGLNMKKQAIIDVSQNLHSKLTSEGFEVLFDDRIDVQAGVKFNDADLLGMPVQIIVGDRKLKDKKVEIKIRKTGERFDVELEKLISRLKEILG